MLTLMLSERETWTGADFMEKMRCKMIHSDLLMKSFVYINKIKNKIKNVCKKTIKNKH